MISNKHTFDAEKAKALRAKIQTFLKAREISNEDFVSLLGELKSDFFQTTSAIALAVQVNRGTVNNWFNKSAKHSQQGKLDTLRKFRRAIDDKLNLKA